MAYWTKWANLIFNETVSDLKRAKIRLGIKLHKLYWHGRLFVQAKMH